MICSKRLKRIFALLLAFAFCLSLFACGGPAGEAADGVSSGSVSGPSGLPEAEAAATQETKNLVKLCKVWGYAKYHHPAFLLGRLDWDKELLQLIPQVQAAQTGEEVNALLHEWFGTMDAYTYGVPETQDASITDDMIVEANTAWTEDTAYLGEELAADLARLAEMPVSNDRTKAPVFFIQPGVPDFFHESDLPAAYEDVGFRLLGVFRLWNAIEYYYPYLHLLDRDWEACLFDAVPAMLAVTEQESYERELFSMAAQLHDPHVMLRNVATGGYPLYNPTEGRYFLPTPLADVDGKLVVTEPSEDCPLAAGDVLLRFNGKSIEDIAEAKRSYYSLPREEALLTLARYPMVSSATEDMEVTVLRGNEELDFVVRGIQHWPQSGEGLPPYEILDGAIGLINPSKIRSLSTLHQTMAAMKDTQALIVDLRQSPGSVDFAWIYFYLLPSLRSAVAIAKPVPGAPGLYKKEVMYYGYDPYYLTQSKSLYPYEKPIAVLTGKTSMSSSEYVATVLRAGADAILIGENTMGTDGNVVYLPLPGNLKISFTSLGVYELDGTQTQRTGIAPDIYVAPTIQGIAEGRDEQMEAAVSYLQNIQ